MDTAIVLERLRVLADVEHRNRPPLIDAMMSLLSQGDVGVLVRVAGHLRAAHFDQRRCGEELATAIAVLGAWRPADALEMSLDEAGLPRDMAHTLAASGIVTVGHAASLRPQKIIDLCGLSNGDVERLQAVVAKVLRPIRRKLTVAPFSGRAVRRCESSR